jgi:cyclase
MLRKRLIGLLPVRDGVVVQSYRFARHLPVGRPEISAEYLDRWGIDEIILVDIGASRAGRSIDPALVERVARRCTVPLAAGGGVRSAAQAGDLLKAGADKIVINTAAIESPSLVTEVAQAFGEQCALVSIDAQHTGFGRVVVRTPQGPARDGRAPDTWLRRMQEAGAGEFLLQSVDRDGMRDGLDLELIREMAASARVPLIVAGGTGHPVHVIAALAIEGVQAVAVGNLLSHAEHSVTLLKSAIRHGGCDVRLDTAFDYHLQGLAGDGRPMRLDEDTVTAFRFASRRAP